MDLLGIVQNIIAGIGVIFMTLFVGSKVMQQKLTMGDFILFHLRYVNPVYPTYYPEYSLFLLNSSLLKKQGISL